MTTVDYGATPISKLKRSALELAYIAAIEQRDRAIDARDTARTEAFLLDGEIHTLRTTNQEQADELVALVARLKRVRATLPTSSPVVLVAQVLAALDGPDNMGFNLGNAIKYIWRADEKGHAPEDLMKALWYVQREIDRRAKLTEQVKAVLNEQPPFECDHLLRMKDGLCPRCSTPDQLAASLAKESEPDVGHAQTVTDLRRALLTPEQETLAKRIDAVQE